MSRGRWSLEDPGTPIDASAADHAIVGSDVALADGDGSLELVGPFTFLKGTGDTGLYVDVHNPSAVAVTYTVKASGDLDLADDTEDVTVAAGATGRVTFTADTDTATVGTADLHLALESDLLGEVDDLDAEIDVVDPAAVSQDLASARHQIAGLAADKVDPAVKSAIVDQLEEAIATVPVKPYAPFTSWSAFIKRQFTDLTAAQPSAAQISNWTTSLSNGTKTKGDLITGLRGSTDNTSKVDPTVRLYRALLGRTPDAGGLKFWVNRRRTGTWTLNRMADHFAASSEFKRKYGTLSNRAFVTRIYTDVLGRTADKGGVDYWTRQLDLKRRSRGAVMVGFSESNEYKTKQRENTDAAVAYIYLMGRTPTSAEVTSWATRQKAGTSLATLAKELLGSAAYSKHIKG